MRVTKYDSSLGAGIWSRPDWVIAYDAARHGTVARTKTLVKFAARLSH